MPLDHTIRISSLVSKTLHSPVDITNPLMLIHPMTQGTVWSSIVLRSCRQYVEQGAVTCLTSAPYSNNEDLIGRTMSKGFWSPIGRGFVLIDVMWVWLCCLLQNCGCNRESLTRQTSNPSYHKEDNIKCPGSWKDCLFSEFIHTVVACLYKRLCVYVSGCEKTTHFTQFIDFELVTPC